MACFVIDLFVQADWGRVLWMLGAGIALFLPGWALAQALLPQANLSSLDRAALGLGVSVALPPLLLELTKLLALRWSATATWVYVGLGLVGIVALLIRARSQWTRPHLETPLPIALLCLLWLIGLLVRLYAVRDFAAGLWGDSVHHTLITQLLIDNGGLFTSWQPYTELATFTYHFGFHANAAFLQWLTGMPSTQSTLLMGQWLNAAAIPLAYVLTVRLTRSTTAGIWAAVFTGFVNTIPAYFVNWGRYTQLAAQVILPTAAIAWHELLADDAPSRLPLGRLIFAALMTAAMALTHYTITIFLVLFVALLVGAQLLRVHTWQRVFVIGLRSAATGALGVVLALPWLLNTSQGYLSRNASAFVSGYVSTARVSSYSQLAPITPLYLKGYLLALGLIGFVMALRMRRWPALLLGLWATALIVAIIPNTFGLPGNGVVDFGTSYMALYIAVLPLAGFAVGALVDGLREGRWRMRWPQWVSAVATLAIAVWGVGWQRSIANPAYQLLTPADARAMQWIEQNTPSNARFWVNSWPAYGGTMIAGTDAGWWIAQLAHRATNVPPMLYGSERGESADFGQRINAAAQTVRARPLTDDKPAPIDLSTATAFDLLRELKITHIFIGSNALPGHEGADWIDAEALRHSPQFKLVYDQDGVLIFELVAG